MKTYEAKDFGYKGHEILMNPETGSTATADQWASDCSDWCTEETSIEEQFNSLVEVE